MNRTDYQEECIKVYLREEYGDLDACDIEFVNSIKDAFRFGIQCADFMPNPGLVDLSKVWHDASEIPNEDSLIILQSIYGDILLRRFANRSSSMTTIQKWAYIEDLLPKKK